MYNVDTKPREYHKRFRTPKAPSHQFFRIVIDKMGKAKSVLCDRDVSKTHKGRLSTMLSWIGKGNVPGSVRRRQEREAGVLYDTVKGL